jgi:tetratricopeptide (TPR) repeat protein
MSTNAGIGSELVETLRSSLENFGKTPDSDVLKKAVIDARHAAAEWIATLPPANKKGQEVEQALALVTFINIQSPDTLPDASDDLPRVDELRKKGWPGLLSLMCLVPSWQWLDAPELDKVPIWLWSAYAQYLLQPMPLLLERGETEKQAALFKRRLDDILKTVRANKGALAVKGILEACSSRLDIRPLVGACEHSSEIIALQNRIMALAWNVEKQEEMLAFPREGRRLKISILVGEDAPSDEALRLGQYFGTLDSEMFETNVFVSAQNLREPALSPVKGATMALLQGGFEDQLITVRDASPDVLVFCGDLTSTGSSLLRFAMHRIAPLQVVFPRDAETAALPQVDMLFCGSGGAERQASASAERLAILPGSGQSYLRILNNDAEDRSKNRAAVGISADAFLYVARVDSKAGLVEARQTWASILEQTPGSMLVVFAEGAPDGLPAWQLRFMNSFGKVAGASQRVAFYFASADGAEEFNGVLKMADVFLDSYPESSRGALANAVQLGIPSVALRGKTCRQRNSSALLSSFGLSGWVADDETKYLERAVSLNSDAALLRADRERAADAMRTTPLPFDALALCDSTAFLVGRAFDEIVNRTNEAFRKDVPLSSTSLPDAEGEAARIEEQFSNGFTADAESALREALCSAPQNPRFRRIFARTLMNKGNAARAAEYLLAIVESGSSSSEVWNELSIALEKGGNSEAALSALKTALELDPKSVDSWLRLHSIAKRCGHVEMKDAAAEILGKIAPQDPRVVDALSTGN